MNQKKKINVFCFVKIKKVSDAFLQKMLKFPLKSSVTDTKNDLHNFQKFGRKFFQDNLYSRK